MSKARDLANSVSTGSILADGVVNLATAEVTGTLPAGNGGTGAATLTANNVILGNGTSAVQFVAPGSTGNVLTSNGTTWTSGALSGSGMVYLSTVTASGASTVDIETTFDSTYDNYVIFANNVQVGTATTQLRCYPKLNGTYTPQSDWGEHGCTAIFASGGTASYLATARIGVGAYVDIISGLDSAQNNRRLEFVMEVMGPVSSSTVGKGIIYRGSHRTDNTNGATFVGGCMFRTTNFDCAALTGIRFQASTGTISGTFRLYGIKNS